MRRLLAHPVTQFAAALLVAFVLVTSLTSWLSARAAQREAIADARSVTTVLGEAVVQPALPRGLVDRDRTALAAFDRSVRSRLHVQSVRRVKLWREDGTIVYSDEPRLIGDRFDLGADELAVLHHGGSDAGISDLSELENRFERGFGDVVEVYTRVRSPEGQPLLFESYYALDDLHARTSEITRSFRPVTLAGTVVLTLLSAPLAWWLTRRLRRDAAAREALLRAAVESSDYERRRIARDLHDGVVQDLAGAAFALAGASRSGTARPGLVDEVGDSVRQSLRSLRSLLVEIYPPDLHETGLHGALDDLLAPVEAGGTTTTLEVSDLPDLASTSAALVWRVAQEAVRNAVRHGRPEHLLVRVGPTTRGVELLVRDDGRGFDTAAPTEATRFGLRGMRDAVREAGGRLEVTSQVGEGTTVRLEVDR